jgi:hypothetical protein
VHDRTWIEDGLHRPAGSLDLALNRSLYFDRNTFHIVQVQIHSYLAASHSRRQGVRRRPRRPL